VKRSDIWQGFAYPGRDCRLWYFIVLASTNDPFKFHVGFCFVGQRNYYKRPGPGQSLNKVRNPSYVSVLIHFFPFPTVPSSISRIGVLSFLLLFFLYVYPYFSYCDALIPYPPLSSLRQAAHSSTSINSIWLLLPSGFLFFSQIHPIGPYSTTSYVKISSNSFRGQLAEAGDNYHQQSWSRVIINLRSRQKHHIRRSRNDFQVFKENMRRTRTREETRPVAVSSSE
jgi:hypothetical protein